MSLLLTWLLRYWPLVMLFCAASGRSCVWLVCDGQMGWLALKSPPEPQTHVLADHTVCITCNVRPTTWLSTLSGWSAAAKMMVKQQKTCCSPPRMRSWSLMWEKVGPLVVCRAWLGGQRAYSGGVQGMCGHTLVVCKAWVCGLWCRLWGLAWFGP